MIFSEQIINYTMKFNNEIIFIKLFDHFKLKHRAEFKKKIMPKKFYINVYHVKKWRFRITEDKFKLYFLLALFEKN